MTQAFNLGQLANKVNTSGQLDASTGLVNTAPVVNGGTGRATLTTGTVLVGNGTSQVTMLAGTTANDVLAWSGTAWASTPAASAGGGGGYKLTSYTSPSTYTKPASLKAIKVTIIGSGAAGANGFPSGIGGGGGAGGAAIYYAQAPSIPGPQPVTAGSGTNSFGAIASATAGSVGSSSVGGAGGVGSGGSININGQSGLNGGGSPGSSGGGGNTILGFGGKGGIAPNGAGQAGGNYGGGGGGGGFPAGAAGAASIGIVIIEEFF
jgi:hypothetical protein